MLYANGVQNGEFCALVQAKLTSLAPLPSRSPLGLNATADTPFQNGLEGGADRLAGGRRRGHGAAGIAAPGRYQHGPHAKVRMPGLAVEPGPTASKCAVRGATSAR